MNLERPTDNEAAMARADLYKLANYSFKLFKMIKDGDELEGWVQAKVTKAADYIASVYHYLEYEMKFSEYGSKLENSDVYTESVKKQFEQKLTEAKAKLDKLKNVHESELTKVGDTKKTSKGGTVTKTATGIKHERDPNSYDDGGDDLDTMSKSGKGTKSHAKSQSAADKKKQAPAQKQSKTGTWGMKDGQKFDNRNKKVKEGTAVPQNPDGATAPPPKGKDGQYPVVTSGPNKGKRWSPNTPGPTNPAMKEATKAKKDYDGDGKVESPKDEVWGSRAKAAAKSGKPFKESAKPDYIDLDKDGNKKEPMKKAAKDAKVKEALKGNQTKLDADKDGKLEKSDFAKLRASKKVKEAVGKCNHTPKGKSCPVHGLKECGSMYEGSTGDYSAKKAASGKDIGKPGKNFAKIEKSAGGGEKGKRIAGAVLAKLRAKG